MAALRFGVVGTGYWAQEAHATALAAHPDAELVAVWGRDPAKTEAARRPLRHRRPQRPGPPAGQGRRGGHRRPPRRPGRAGRAGAPPAATCCSTSPWPCRWTRPTGSPRRGRPPGGHPGLLHPPVPARGGRLDGAGHRHRAAGTAATAPGWERPCSRAARSPARRGGSARAPCGTSARTCCRSPCPPSARWSGSPPGPASATPSTWSCATGGGASSTLTLSQTVPAAAEGIDFHLWGPEGRAAAPAFGLDHLVALEAAIGQLTELVATGASDHPCDVRLGRDTVAVLEAAERFLAAGPDARGAAVR